MLKGRILPQHREHGGGKCVLKMSTVRYASVLAIFAIFLCEYIDKMNKKVHNKFTNEYRHTGTGLARDLREYRETG